MLYHSASHDLFVTHSLRFTLVILSSPSNPTACGTLSSIVTGFHKLSLSIGYCWALALLFCYLHCSDTVTDSPECNRTRLQPNVNVTDSPEPACRRLPPQYTPRGETLSFMGVGGGCRRWYTVNAERPWPGPHANSPGGRRSILVTGIYVI